MAAIYLSLETLAPALAKNALVLVPNNRLRNHLLRAYAAQQTSQAWLKPNIQSLSQWLAGQWEALQDTGASYCCSAIATPLQRQIIWEGAIKRSPLGATLLQPKPLAQQADSAFKNMELWQLSETDLVNHFSDERSNSAQFLAWSNEFRHLLKLQNCITREASFTLVAKGFIDGDLGKSEEIYLEGFDDLPPLMQHVLSVASHHLIRAPDQAAVVNDLCRVETATQEDEIRSAALWSRAMLSTTPDTALIGIVVPDLGQRRDQVERIFTEVFESHALLPHVARYTLPFNFSAGTPLGTCPLINSLFDILRLQDSDWSLESMCNLLISPFWGNAQKEMGIRTHLITELSQLGRINISTGDLRYCARRLEERIPALIDAGIADRFENMGNLLRKRFDNKLPSEWLEVFDQLLAIMNWPGERRLDSQEYQQLNQWFEVRDQFIGLDNYAAPISYQHACRYLRELADKTPFQAQTPDSPIQILGALEAAGLQFSHLWVMGLSDSQWPPAPAPNPLLPLHLQRLHDMPHASATRELEIARVLTHRYKQSAQHIVLSSAHGDGDNELRPSALIRDVPLADLQLVLGKDKSDLQVHYEVLHASTALEVIHDARGPKLGINEPVRGGSSLFKYQAACPFEAFVRLRLGARNPDEPQNGFSAIERGNLLHDSLARLWLDLKNSQNLAALDNESLKSIVNEITQKVVTEIQARNPHKLGRMYCALEQQRLTHLLCGWLEGERARPAFEVVAIEQDNTVEFAGLKLTLRIDRIDKFNNGDRLLIDYKTGKTSLKSWQSDRMTEPQLPLYAVTEPDIAAISFAQINRQNQKWEGMGQLHDTSLEQPGIKPVEDWAMQLREWRSQLQQLARDFSEGDARIDFKDAVLASYAEDLLPLTRLPDATLLTRYSQDAEKV